MFSYAHVPWLRKQQGAFATHLPEGREKFQIFRAGLEAISRRRISLHRHGPFRAAGRRTRHGAAKPHAAPEFSRLHHEGRRGPLRHGRERDQFDWRSLRAESARGSGVSRRRWPSAASPPCADTGFLRTTVLRRAVIGRLLCHTVIPKREVEREFSISFDEYFAPEIARLAEPSADGLVILDRDEIRVTPLGRIFIRNVAMVFDRYLRGTENGPEAPVFENAVSAPRKFHEHTSCRNRRGNFGPRLRVPALAAGRAGHAAGSRGTRRRTHRHGAAGRVSVRNRTAKLSGHGFRARSDPGAGTRSRPLPGRPARAAICAAQRAPRKDSDVAAGHAGEFPAGRRARGGRLRRKRCGRTKPPTRRRIGRAVRAAKIWARDSGISRRAVCFRSVRGRSGEAEPARGVSVTRGVGAIVRQHPARGDEVAAGQGRGARCIRRSARFITAWRC